MKAISILAFTYMAYSQDFKTLNGVRIHQLGCKSTQFYRNTCNCNNVGVDVPHPQG